MRLGLLAVVGAVLIVGVPLLVLVTAAHRRATPEKAGAAPAVLKAAKSDRDIAKHTTASRRGPDEGELNMLAICMVGLFVVTCVAVSVLCLSHVTGCGVGEALLTVLVVLSIVGLVFVLAGGGGGGSSGNLVACWRCGTVFDRSKAICCPRCGA